MYTSHIVEYVVHMHNTTLKLASTCRSRGHSTCYKFTYSRGVFNTTAFNTLYTTCNWSYSLYKHKYTDIYIYIHTYIRTYIHTYIQVPDYCLTWYYIAIVLHSTYICMYVHEKYGPLTLSKVAKTSREFRFSRVL